MAREGNSFTRGNAGQGGYSAAFFDRDASDGAAASLNGSTLTFGIAGPGGFGGGVDGAYTNATDGLIADQNF